MRLVTNVGPSWNALTKNGWYIKFTPEKFCHFSMSWKSCIGTFGSIWCDTAQNVCQKGFLTLFMTGWIGSKAVIQLANLNLTWYHCMRLHTFTAYSRLSTHDNELIRMWSSREGWSTWSRSTCHVGTEDIGSGFWIEKVTVPGVTCDSEKQWCQHSVHKRKVCDRPRTVNELLSTGLI